MTRTTRPPLPLLALAALLLLAPPLAADETTAEAAAPEIRSMSALAFGPDGVLFVGDGKGAAVHALKITDPAPAATEARLQLDDVEGKIAALLGTRAEMVMIHDLAVHPASGNVYLAVSRGRGDWNGRWLLPNDVADASILLRVGRDGEIGEVPLAGVAHSRAALPNPVAEEKTHRFKEGVSLRTDAITDLAYADGTLYVAGLSNEEFASTLWRFPYPFGGEASATTVEIFHGAHGRYETASPIRTFLPYALDGKPHLLAAYLCTPLVTLDAGQLADGAHVKGRTVAEFGSGNYPLDMIVYKKGDEERILIANSNLPLMIVKPADLEGYRGSITEEVEGYTAGVPYEIRSGTGVLQMDRLDDEHVVVLRRTPAGTAELTSLSVSRL